MKKIIFIMTAILVFLFFGCSDTQNLTNLSSLLLAKNTLSSNESDSELIPVELCFAETDSRTLMPTFYEQAKDSRTNWTAVCFPTAGDPFELTIKQDNNFYERLWLYVELNKTYDKIVFTGINNDACEYFFSEVGYKECKVTYSGVLENISFSLEKRDSIKVPYTIDSIETPDGTDYYADDNLRYIAKVHIKGEFSVFASCSADLINLDDNNIFYSCSTPSSDDNGVVFNFTETSPDNVTEGLYRFVLNTDSMNNDFNISELLYSDYDSIYVMKYNYADAYFTPITDERFYSVYLHATTTPEADGDGSSVASPKYIKTVFEEDCKNEAYKYKNIYIYCDDSFILDYEDLYGEDGSSGLFGALPDDAAKTKSIRIITPSTTYRLEAYVDDSDPDNNGNILSIYGENVKLKGKGTYSTFNFYLYDSVINYPYGNSHAISVPLFITLYEGAAIDLKNITNSQDVTDGKIIFNFKNYECLNVYDSPDHTLVKGLKNKADTYTFNFTDNNHMKKVLDTTTQYFLNIDSSTSYELKSTSTVDGADGYYLELQE